MPETMRRVEAILDWLAERQVPPVTLLVVPGKDWTPSQIERLRELAQHGHPLAAHGWHHHTTPRKLYHRLHSLLISRDVAEHLDLDSSGVLDLLNRSQAWFPQNNLPTPTFYVPPAWALGPITAHHLNNCPFQLIETTRGLIHPRSTQPKKIHPLPLTGYEADTPLRETFLRTWNQAQANKAQRTQKPLRISIHPDDLQLRTADQLKKHIQTATEFLNYD